MNNELEDNNVLIHRRCPDGAAQGPQVTTRVCAGGDAAAGGRAADRHDGRGGQHGGRGHAPARALRLRVQLRAAGGHLLPQRPGGIVALGSVPFAVHPRFISNFTKNVRIRSSIV